MTEEIKSTISDSAAVQATERWLASVVIKLNLCPFANREYQSGRVRIVESGSRNQEDLLKDMVVEMSLLTRRPEIETTLLVVPHTLSEFGEFNQFLEFVETVIAAMQLEGVYQVASFHPDYQFANTDPDDVQNYTNRSPFPVLHILRESSLSRAVENHPDTEQIPADNIRLMENLGTTHMRTLLDQCITDAH